jgi:hypothetical protein
MASSAFECQTIIIICWKISCPKWDIPKNSKKFSIFLHKIYFFLEYIYIFEIFNISETNIISVEAARVGIVYTELSLSLSLFLRDHASKLTRPKGDKPTAG